MLKLRKLALIASALLMGAAASAVENGPNPSASSVERNGAYATGRGSVSALSASGFGGGDLYYPTASGTYGAIALCPGFTAGASSLAWLGPRLASHGFVVLIIETNTRLDQPDARGRQLKAAIDYLKAQNSRTGVLRGKIDTSRVAVGGHSMGGGGTLEAVRDNPDYKAGLPLAPWNLTKSFSRIRVPTAIIGGSADTVAPDGQHSIPFYTSISSSTPKLFLELTLASHFFPQSSDSNVSRIAVSWYKRWLDEDTRYGQFLTSRPSGASDFRRAGF